MTNKAKLELLEKLLNNLMDSTWQEITELAPRHDLEKHEKEFLQYLYGQHEAYLNIKNWLKRADNY